MKRYTNRRFRIALMTMMPLGAVGLLWVTGWSLSPFGKRYLPDYYFDQLHAHHKNYVSGGERLVILNGTPVDSLRERQVVGVTKAVKIVEYSSSEASARFGEAGQYGATEIIGKDVEWVVSNAAIHRRRFNPDMILMHTGVPLPSKANPGHDAILASGESADTLYLGTTRYRSIRRDTANKIVLAPSRFFFANRYKRIPVSNRRLLVYRYNRLEATFMDVEVEGNDGVPYFYDERVVTFSRWVDNTVSAVMNRQQKTGKLINDGRLLAVNGKMLRGERLTRVQATRGKVIYLNGILATKKYGLKGYAGAVEISGNGLKFFR
ncbi:hypothetical protein JHJ32_03065 [Parapedobacter sp. ISTM3]|uniref:hypothetical protein n=1 Tax=Parapedobacter sp. ISTM3 TaxID=2800130 RepID=UPI001904C846|nr:hypothetical protein [Parapedobacter sp. ISTM3]MBK1438957.1 hypothetical protein [Parapedobacter sp. ISTM3]